MTDKEVLQRYIDVLPFFGKVCGPGAELVVHDLSDPEHSLVAIENNVSGRQIGNPMTDLVRELIRGSPQRRLQGGLRGQEQGEEIPLLHLLYQK